MKVQSAKMKEMWIISFAFLGLLCGGYAAPDGKSSTETPELVDVPVSVYNINEVTERAVIPFIRDYIRFNQLDPAELPNFATSSEHKMPVWPNLKVSAGIFGSNVKLYGLSSIKLNGDFNITFIGENVIFACQFEFERLHATFDYELKSHLWSQSGTIRSRMNNIAAVASITYNVPKFMFTPGPLYSTSSGPLLIDMDKNPVVDWVFEALLKKLQVRIKAMFIKYGTNELNSFLKTGVDNLNELIHSNFENIVDNVKENLDNSLKSYLKSI